MKTRIESEVERILLDDYQRYYRLAYSYVGNEADALDIVQESAYKAIKDCRKVREPDYIGTWIHRIVINTALDFLRKQKKESPGMAEEEMEISYVDQYRDMDLMEVLKQLEEKDRTIIVLRYFEDMKLEDVARATGDNVNTVKTRLYRALKRLRIDLEPDELEKKGAAVL